MISVSSGANGLWSFLVTEIKVIKFFLTRELKVKGVSFTFLFKLGMLYTILFPPLKERIISFGLGILTWGSELVMDSVILQDNSGFISHSVSTSSARLFCFYQTSSLFVCSCMFYLLHMFFWSPFYHLSLCSCGSILKNAHTMLQPMTLLCDCVWVQGTQIWSFMLLT